MKKATHTFHVELKDATKKHYYFGSLSAIYDTFAPEQLGIKLTSLWSNHNFDSEPYENKLCIIRKGELKRKKSNRGKK